MKNATPSTRREHLRRGLGAQDVQCGRGFRRRLFVARKPEDCPCQRLQLANSNQTQSMQMYSK